MVIIAALSIYTVGVARAVTSPHSDSASVAVLHAIRASTVPRSARAYLVQVDAKHVGWICAVSASRYAWAIRAGFTPSRAWVHGRLVRIATSARPFPRRFATAGRKVDVLACQYLNVRLGHAPGWVLLLLGDGSLS